MNSEIAEEWISRLESGKYQQGIYYLRNGDKYCCLGVLCEIAVERGVIEQLTSGDEVVRYFANSEPWKSEASLPNSVVEWAEMHSSDGELPDNDDLTVHNDVHRDNFLEIARLIRANIDAL